MTKGQRAMTVAMILADREYKNYTLGVSKQYVSFARTVLDSAPDIADLPELPSTTLTKKAPGGLGRGKSHPTTGKPFKHATLKSAGLSTSAANRYERIADIPAKTVVR